MKDIQVGDNVVCVDTSNWRCPDNSVSSPKLGEVYQVREIVKQCIDGSIPEFPGLVLGGFGEHDCFYIWRFKKVLPTTAKEKKLEKVT